MLWISLLIVHGLLAFALLGAVTHQAISVLGRTPSGRFISSYTAVRSDLFTNAVTALFLITFFFGGWIYTHYRVASRPVLEDLNLQQYVGIFEFKEHVLSIAFFMLPAYWLFWKMVPLTEQKFSRAALTWLVAASVWIGFLAGHLVNNARGL